MSFPSMLRKPESIASLDTRSNAPIPSTDKTVLSGWRSVRAWMACPTHSVPARVDRACWNGPPLHRCGNLLGHNSGHGLSERVSHDNAPHPASGLAQNRHPTQTDPFHHLNRHLCPDKLLSHLPQHLAVPKRCSGPLSSAQWSSLMGLRQLLCHLAEHTSRTCPDPERIAWRGAINSCGLLAGFVRAALVVSSPGAHVAPSSASLAEESSPNSTKACARSALFSTLSTCL